MSHSRTKPKRKQKVRPERLITDGNSSVRRPLGARRVLSAYATLTVVNGVVPAYTLTSAIAPSLSDFPSYSALFQCTESVRFRLYSFRERCPCSTRLPV